MADTNIEMILRMPFLIFSNKNIHFAKKKLTWRSYIAAKALPITKRIELINKKEFAKTALDEKLKTFVVYIAPLKASPKSAEMIMHFSQVA